ncbi:MAG: succinate dehydrogenase, cytochrome b556 subunit [Gammaproteobacteria bacterium]|jgi:fumarate reductase subunit D|nr:MAG: succinate dehydrogenase, cytochrome b556 subunit [Gammaproteobacteria bacterium]
MIRPHRGHPLWLAYILHRLSGLALAMFLPAHFYVLSLALTAPKNLNDFLRWADNPLVKVAEFGLVFLLAVHFFGGLRLMAFEFLDWSKNQKTWAAAIVAFAFMIASGFLLRAI